MGNVKRLADKPKDWHEIVGMPDDLDKKNIQNLINIFKKKRFSVKGEVFTGAEGIERSIEETKKSGNAVALEHDYGLKSHKSQLRIEVAIPTPLKLEIENAYPTMFRDERHFEWFKKNFKQFVVTKKG